MEINELQKTSLKAREDASRLSNISNIAFKVWMTLIWIVAGLSLLITCTLFIAALALRTESSILIGFGYGFSVIIVSGIFCTLNYIAALLFTHLTKAVARLLETNLVIIEHFERQINFSKEKHPN